MYQIKDNLKAMPYVLYPAQDGTVWIVAFSIDDLRIVQLSPSTGFKVYLTMKDSAGLPQDIVVDHGGAVWFPQNSSLVRLDPVQNKTTRVSLPPKSFPTYMVIDKQNNVWVTLAGMDANQIALHNPTDNTTRFFSVPSPGAAPEGITIAQDGSVWFTEAAVGKLGRLNPRTGEITEYSSPLKLVAPIQVAVDQNGVVWFTDHGTNEFGSFTPQTNQWIKYPAGYCKGICSLTLPNAISVDPLGKVWFSEHFSGRIARYDPALNLLTEYIVALPPGTPSSASAYVWWGLPGPDNRVWFTSLLLGSVGYVDPTISIPLTIKSENEVSVTPGSSSSVGVTASFVGGSAKVDLGISVSMLDDGPAYSFDLGQGYSQIQGSFTLNQVELDGQPKVLTAIISAAANATLGVHHVTLTASDGRVAVGIPLKVIVTRDQVTQAQTQNQLPSISVLRVVLPFAVGAALVTFGIALYSLRTKKKGAKATGGISPINGWDYAWRCGRGN